MRKFSLFMLMAVGLLISTSMSAGPAKVAPTREAKPEMPQVEMQQMAEPQPFAMAQVQGTSMHKAPKKAAQNEDAQAKVYLKKYTVLEPEVSMMSVTEAFNYVNTEAKFGKYDTVVVELQGDVTFANITGSYGFTLNAGKTMLLELNGYSMIATINQSGTTALICNNGRMIINDNSADEFGIGNGKISFYSETVDQTAVPSYASNTINNYGTLVVMSSLIENWCKEGGATFAIDTYNSNRNDTLIINNGKVFSNCGTAIRQGLWNDIYTSVFILNNGIIESKGYAMWTHLTGGNTTNAYKAIANFSGGKVIAGQSNYYAYYDYTYGSTLGGIKVNISGTEFEGLVGFGSGASNKGVSNYKSEEITILGGEIPVLYLFSGYQTINMTDGHIAGNVTHGMGNTTFNISGGTIDGYLYVYTYGNNKINISGSAKLGSYIYCAGSSNTNINLDGGSIYGISVYNSASNDQIKITSGTCGYIGISDVTNSALSITDGFLCSDIEVSGETNTAEIKGGFFAYDSDDGYYYCHYGCDNSSIWPTYIADGFTKIANYDEGGQQIQWPVADDDGDYGYYWKIGQETKPEGGFITDPEDSTTTIKVIDPITEEVRDPEPTDNIIITKNDTVSQSGEDTQFGRDTVYLDQLNVNGITFAGRDTIDVIAKPGSVVNVGSSGIKASDTTTVYMTVEGGGAMKVGVEAIQKVDTVIVKSDNNGNGTLLISPNAQLTEEEKFATVKLYVDGARKVDDTYYIWQHIAVPTDGTGTFTVENDRKATDPDFLTFVQYWDQTLTSNDKWHQINSWEEMNKPWQGFILTTNSTTPGVTYSFTGNIIGNNDGQLHFDAKGYNFFGNSFTAPINVQTMLNGISNGEDIEMTVWIYSADKRRYLESNNLMRLLGMPEFDQISSMQGFWLRNMTDDYELNGSVNYTNAVWNNPGAMSNPKVKAPARRQVASEMGLSTAQIIVSNDSREDKLLLVEGSEYTERFDNGSDASKMIDENAFNIYATTTAGDLACVATDELAGTMLSFKAVEAGEYTMTFANTVGKEYVIYDMMTGQTIKMTEGGAYTFFAEAGLNEGRFMINQAPGSVTEMEKVQNASAIKGVYNMLGQYVANTADWSKLSAGIYVVDGVKVIK